MVLAGVTLLVAVLLGWASGGSLVQLGALPLRRRSLVWTALGTQAAGTVVGGPAYPVGLALSAALVAWFLVANRGIRGTGLLALGLLANALVVCLNGAMPVSVAAADRAGTTTQQILVGDDPRHQIADRRTVLAPLGDVIPVRAPWRPEVVSPGDVLVAAGLAQLVLIGMRRGPGRPRRRWNRLGPRRDRSSAPVASGPD